MSCVAVCYGLHTFDKEKLLHLKKYEITMTRAYIPLEFYIHGPVRRHSVLIKSNKVYQMQVFIYCLITLHVSGVYRTHN